MKLGQALVGQMMAKKAVDAPVAKPQGPGLFSKEYWMGPNRPPRPEINWDTVQRYGTGGLAIGGGLAAALNMIRMLREKREEKAIATEPSETEANTIVLTLPRKTAQMLTPTKPKTAVKPTGPKTGIYTGPGNQTRHPSGKIGPTTIKGAQEGWKTYTGSMLAGGLGVGVGAAVVNKLYEMRREKELKDKVEAAKQQYLDKLQGKMAEDFLHTTLTKAAGDGGSTFNYTALPGGLAALAYVLTAGGGGYLVKRMLDEKFRQAKQEGLDLPKVKRIVFKSAPAQLPEGEKEEPITPEEQEAIKTSFHAMRKALSGDAAVLNDPKVKEAADMLGLDVGEMQKTAQMVDQDVEELMRPITQATNDPTWRQRAGVLGLRSKGVPGMLAPMVHAIPGVHGMVQQRVGQQVSGVQNDARSKLYAQLGKTAPESRTVAPPPDRGGGITGFGRYVGSDLQNTFGGPGNVGTNAQREVQGWNPGMAKQIQNYSQQMAAAKENPMNNFGQWLQGGQHGWGQRLMGWFNMLRQWFQHFGPQMWQQKQGEEYFRKYAEGIGLPMDLLSNLVAGNMIVEGAKPDLADSIAQAQLKLEATKKRKQQPATAVQSVKLEGADPEANAYLEQNKAKILKVMQDMAASGKL